jgi:hypothetical protein
MRLQDKIKGHKIARRDGEGQFSLFGEPGPKEEDELPVPHHSGFVLVDEVKPVFHHQRFTQKEK